MKWSRLCRTATIALLWTSLSQAAEQPLLLDEMAGPRLAVQLVSNDGPAKILEHSLAAVADDPSQIAERIVVAAPPGTSASLGYRLPRLAVIDELRIAVDASCSRAGMQLAATVVLPHALDPKTNLPRRLLVRSSRPTLAAGRQQLVLRNIPRLVGEAARVASAKFGAVVEREAYVADLVILVPGGRGAAEVFIDQIAVFGVMQRSAEFETQAAAAVAAETTADPAAIRLASESRPAPPPMAAKRIAVPRAVQWQGETFESLQRVGFNAAWLRRPATAEELAAASAKGMPLICVPPPVQSLAAGSLGRQYDAVLAWDLGRVETTEQLQRLRAWKSALGRAETQRDRPTLVRSHVLPREASRIADVFILEAAQALGASSSIELTRWFAERQDFLQPGAPTWVELATDDGPRAAEQLSLLRGVETKAPPVAASDFLHANLAALLVQPRGLLLRSRGSLAATDAFTTGRVRMMQLALLQWKLMDPWLVSGKSPTPIHCSSSQVVAASFTSERSQLIVAAKEPFSHVDAAVPNAPSAVRFIVPAAPETATAHLLVAGGLCELRTQRITGGVEIEVPAMEEQCQVLITEDSTAISQVHRFLQQTAPLTAQANIQLASQQRQQAAAALAELPAELIAAVDGRAQLAVVDRELSAVSWAIQQNQHGSAAQHAEAASRALDALRRRLRTQLSPTLAAGGCSLPADWSTLADDYRFCSLIGQNAAPFLPLPGGGFNDPAQVVAAGWQRGEALSPDIAASARPSTNRPFEGTRCLELAARAANSPAAPRIPASPAWVTSPRLTAPVAAVLEITAQVRLSEPPLRSRPMLIYDSIGGIRSAACLHAAPDWTLVHLARAVPAGAECQAILALGGTGQAEIDDVRYRLTPLAAAVANRNAAARTAR